MPHEMARALCDAGYMPLPDYLAMYAENGWTNACRPRMIRQPFPAAMESRPLLTTPKTHDSNSPRAATASWHGQFFCP